MDVYFTTDLVISDQVRCDLDEDNCLSNLYPGISTVIIELYHDVYFLGSTCQKIITNSGVFSLYNLSPVNYTIYETDRLSFGSTAYPVGGNDKQITVNLVEGIIAIGFNFLKNLPYHGIARRRRNLSPKKRNKLTLKNPWNLVWIVLIGVVVITALVNYVQGFFWYGFFSQDLLIIGTIDAVIVALIVTPLAIKLGLIEQERIKEELETLALTDDLTKLNNRRGFFHLAEHLLKIAHRNKNGMYLMYTDLDNFKKINDEFGHAEGDRALQAFARLLIENYRESDIIARLGGDEFVLLPVGTSKDGIDVIRNRFYAVLASFNDTKEHPWTLSASIGLAYFDPYAPCSLEKLIKQADDGLYVQKKS